MKNTALVLSISLFLIPFLTPAQDQQGADPKEDSRAAKKQVLFGVRAGLSKSNIYAASSVLSASPRNGFSGGVFMALPIGSLLGIQPELILIQKGFSGTGTMNGERYDIIRTTTHLDIPIQVQLKPFRWLTILAGPQYSYLLKQTDQVTYGTAQQPPATRFSDVDLNQNLFGTLVGFDINVRHLMFSWRSGWDLTASPRSNTAAVPGYRNRWTQLTLGYRFY
jgi:hypothetical protein